MLAHCRTAVVMLALLTVITGLAYPALVTAIACVAAALVLYAIVVLLVGVADDDDSTLGLRRTGIRFGTARPATCRA